MVSCCWVWPQNLKLLRDGSAWETNFLWYLPGRTEHLKGFNAQRTVATLHHSLFSPFSDSFWLSKSMLQFKCDSSTTHFLAPSMNSCHTLFFQWAHGHKLIFVGKLLCIAKSTWNQCIIAPEGPFIGKALWPHVSSQTKYFLLEHLHSWAYNFPIHGSREPLLFHLGTTSFQGFLKYCIYLFLFFLLIFWYILWVIHFHAQNHS